MTISYVGAGPLASSTTGSVTPAHPSGVETGDILIASPYSWVGNTPTPPAGLNWALIQTGLNGARLSAYWRLFTAGDVAGAFSGGGTSGYYAAISAWRGVDPVAPLDGTVPPPNTGATAIATAPSLTTLNPGSMVVSSFANRNNGADIGFSEPTNGFTLRYGGVSYISGAGSDGALGLTSKLLDTPDASGPNSLAVDDDYGFGALQWVALTFALRERATDVPGQFLPFFA